MKQLNIILKIWYEEFVDVFHDRGVLIFILFVPICYPLLYSYIYTNEVVREVPIIAVDNSGSSLSRQLLRNIDACPDVKIIHYCGDMAEAQDLVRKREAYGIVRIPKDIGKHDFLGDQSTIGVYCDMSSMLYYKAIVLATTNTSLAMNEEIKIKEHIHGTTKEQDKINRLPIKYEQIAIFNSQSGFASFLIPPVLMLIIQQTLLLGIGMSTGRIRERNMGCIIPLRKLYKDSMNIVIGRSLCIL